MESTSASSSEFADYGETDSRISDSEYEDIVAGFFWPTAFQLATLPVFGLLLFVGLLGNGLVAFVVVKNKTMRTATNIFLVNLALADFLVLLCCLPFSVLWDMTSTWWFGTLPCKLLLFLQNLSITVSVCTLVCISVERWYAICHPMRFRITFSWTRNMLLLVWTTGILCSLPEAATVHATPFDFPRENFSSTWLTTCADQWGSRVQLYYQATQSLLLLILPLLAISLIYGHIAYKLWGKGRARGTLAGAGGRGLRGIAFRQMLTTANALACSVEHTSGGCSAMAVLEEAAAKATGQANALSALQRQAAGRRKAAKMMIAVVVLFGVCYLPVHSFNLLRSVDLMNVRDPLAKNVCLFVIRFLTYFNSCVNPIIYNFMSGKFRREFRRAMTCRKRRRRGAGVAGSRWRGWNTNTNTLNRTTGSPRTGTPSFLLLTRTMTTSPRTNSPRPTTPLLRVTPSPAPLSPLPIGGAPPLAYDWSTAGLSSKANKKSTKTIVLPTPDIHLEGATDEGEPSVSSGGPSSGLVGALPAEQLLSPPPTAAAVTVEQQARTNSMPDVLYPSPIARLKYSSFKF